ncbi:MAG: hypothetical protein ACXWU5_07190, partial [Rhodoplanes sp.]
MVAPFWALSIAAATFADTPTGALLVFPSRLFRISEPRPGNVINTAIRIMLSAVVRTPPQPCFSAYHIVYEFVRKNVVTLVEVAHSGLGYKSVP